MCFWRSVPNFNAIPKNLMLKKIFESWKSKEQQFSCWSSSQGKLYDLYSYFPLVLYIDVIHICKKKKWIWYLWKKMKNKKILVTFWDYTDNSNQGLIYPYTFLYIIIILTYRKLLFLFIFIYTQLIKKNLLWKNQHHLSHSFTWD